MRRGTDERGVVFEGVAARHAIVFHAGGYRLKAAEEKHQVHHLLRHSGRIFVDPKTDLRGIGFELAGAVVVHLGNDIATGWNDDLNVLRTDHRAIARHVAGDERRTRNTVCPHWRHLEAGAHVVPEPRHLIERIRHSIPTTVVLHRLHAGGAVQVSDERVVHNGSVARKKLYGADTEIIRPVERKNKIAVDVFALRPQLRDRGQIDNNVGRPKNLFKRTIIGQRSQGWRIVRISLRLLGGYPLPKHCHVCRARRRRAREF